MDVGKIKRALKGRTEDRNQYGEIKYSKGMIKQTTKEKEELLRIE